MKYKTTNRIAAILVTGGIVLTGCSKNEDKQESASPSQPQTTASSEAPKESAPTHPSGSAKPSPTTGNRPPSLTTSDQPSEESQHPAPAKNSCSSTSGQQTLLNNIGKVTPKKWDWDPTYADSSTYDPCAPLSWIVVPIARGTSSSPYQIMLFHHGEYIGTTTSEAYGFSPTVTRAGKNSINVVYHYPLPGESNATRSGQAHASFTWDDATQRVVMQGNVPPA